MPDPDEYRPCNKVLAFIYFFLSPRRYLQAAVEQAAWIELRSNSVRQKFLEGNYIAVTDKNWADETARYHALHRKLCKSLAEAIGVVAGALLLASLLGHLDGQLTQKKGLSVLSVFLVAWAALFSRGGPPREAETIAKLGLSETMHPVIYMPIYVAAAIGHILSVLS